MTDATETTEGESTFFAQVRLGRGQVQKGKLRGVEIGVAVLSGDESQLSTAAAHEHMKEIGLDINLLSADELDSERAVQMLTRALCAPGKADTKVFRDAAQLRKELTDDEIALAWSDYLAAKNSIAAKLDTLEPDKVQEILEAIKKKDGIRLLEFGRYALSSFLITMGPLLLVSPMAKSLSISELAESLQAKDSENPPPPPDQPQQ